MTGIHLMRTGAIEPNLPRLNQIFQLPHLDELIARKVEGQEKQTLPEADLASHEREYQRLQAELEEAEAQSTLPDRPTARPALNDLLLHLRLGGKVHG